ncbi:MAG: hypothetical protein PHO56_02140 [Patescibacteria group bacterium]|nr:hypothetical protein [Patescibacteria group bacterium]
MSEQTVYWKRKFNKGRQAIKKLKQEGFGEIYQIEEGSGFDLLAIKNDEIRLIRIVWENPGDAYNQEEDGPVKKEIWHFPHRAMQPKIFELNKVIK